METGDGAEYFVVRGNGTSPIVPPAMKTDGMMLSTSD